MSRSVGRRRQLARICDTERRALLLRWAHSLSLLIALASAGCMSLSTNIPILSDQSHLGTPYSGVRIDSHILVCFGKTIPRDPSILILTPLALLYFVDLPFSTAADTLLLPLDIPREPEARPLVPGRGSCKLIGM
jgi:uncharacterized protein YceK